MEPKKSSSKVFWLLLGAGLPVFLGIASWRLGSDHGLWQVVTTLFAILIIGLIVGAGAGISDWLKGQMPAPGKDDVLLYLAILGYCGLLGGVWIVIGMRFPHTDVYVDNFSKQKVVLEINGSRWLSIDPGTKLETRLLQGTHELVVRSEVSGAELDRQTIKVEPKVPYVLNVLGAQTYYQGSVRYGMDFGFSGGFSPREVKDVWIKADVDYLFKEPPENISVPVSRYRVMASESRSYLTRTRPKAKGSRDDQTSSESSKRTNHR